MPATMRPAAVIIALLIYGCWSLPAPPGFDWPELAIGILMIAAVGPGRAIRIGSGGLGADPAARPLERIGTWCLLYLLWVPLLIGVARGWEANDILRDVVPLAYLFLPLLLATRLDPTVCRRPGGDSGLPAGSAERTTVLALAGGLAGAGVAFTVRWWIDHRWGFGAVGRRAMTDGAGYFLNSPAVLFAALWLPLAAIDRLLAPGRRPRWAAVAIAGIGASTGLLCLAALAGAVHRLALLGATIVGLVALLRWLRRTPTLIAGATLAGAILIIVLDLPAAAVVGQIIDKSVAVGSNQRLAEFGAVLEQAGDSVPTLLIGAGWGALIANPAVGDWRVSYTHSLPSYMILKAGLIGALVLLAWLAASIPAATRLYRRDPILALAVAPCLAIGLTAHTSFKYLCFGLLLTLVAEAGAATAPRP